MNPLKYSSTNLKVNGTWLIIELETYLSSKSYNLFSTLPIFSFFSASWNKVLEGVMYGSFKIDLMAIFWMNWSLLILVFEKEFKHGKL